MQLPTLVTVLGLMSSANAWGRLGHKTVANVALQLLQPGVADTLSAILAADGNKALPSPSIVDIATLPDDYAHSPEGKWTRHFHYIDAKDNPPFECNVDMARDCDAHGGCVVSAIANYTGQLVHPSRNVNETAQALKFVVHFLGDIAQPLHNEFIAWGGNGIMVKWEGETKRLHGVWDYSIIEKWVGPDDQHSLEWWTNAIVDEIKDGIYKDSVSGWLEHTDINDAENSVLQWAIDSNKLICEFVLKTDPKGKELSGSYYRGAAPIVQQQIAKAGVRLASWLNQIFGAAVPGSLPLHPGAQLISQVEGL